MARPTKQGIDYFPLDCHFDDKTEMFIIETGAVGMAVLITIWQMIYSNDGYFIVDDNDLRLLIKHRINTDINQISDIIEAALRRKIFCQKLHSDHDILTSKSIQKRYFDISKKKKHVAVVSEYLTIDVNSYINLVYSDENTVNVDGNATKVKVKEELKVNVNGNKEKGVKKRFVPPTINEVEGYAKEAGLNVDPGVFVDFYASKDWKVGSAKMKDWKAACRNWSRRNHQQTGAIHEKTLSAVERVERATAERQRLRDLGK